MQDAPNFDTANLPTITDLNAITRAGVYRLAGDRICTFEPGSQNERAKARGLLRDPNTGAVEGQWMEFHAGGIWWRPYDASGGWRDWVRTDRRGPPSAAAKEADHA